MKKGYNYKGYNDKGYNDKGYNYKGYNVDNEAVHRQRSLSANLSVQSNSDFDLNFCHSSSRVFGSEYPNTENH